MYVSKGDEKKSLIMNVLIFKVWLNFVIEIFLQILDSD